jgi:phage terminase small subunit
MENRPLTAKQFKFVQAILEDSTGFDAAKIAGYKGNDNVLRAIASENLTKPNIKAVIEEHRAKIEAETDFTVEQWRNDCKDARNKALVAKQYSAVAAFDRLLGQHKGVFELDNEQKQAQQELSAQEAAEARRLAVLLNHKAG